MHLQWKQDQVLQGPIFKRGPLTGLYWAKLSFVLFLASAVYVVGFLRQLRGFRCCPSFSWDFRSSCWLDHFFSTARPRACKKLCNKPWIWSLWFAMSHTPELRLMCILSWQGWPVFDIISCYDWSRRLTGRPVKWIYCIMRCASNDQKKWFVVLQQPLMIYGANKPITHWVECWNVWPWSLQLGFFHCQNIRIWSDGLIAILWPFMKSFQNKADLCKGH